MIGPADDFLIHQTHEPVLHVATSDRRFYDRYFFTGHACDESLFFMIGMGVYPNLGVIDAFASVAHGDTQTTTRGSRELGFDRMNTTRVGPIDIEVLEGLRRIRLRGHPGEAVSFDLEWNGAVPAFDEPPIFNRVMNRVMEQATRLIQTGTWSGHIVVKGERIDLDPATAWGARDRSWGVRSIGLEREPKGIQQAHRMGDQRPPLWIWSPMQFCDATIHFNLAEHASGEREMAAVRRVPSFARGGEMVNLRNPDHQLRFEHETRELLADSQVSFDDVDGSRRTVTLEPLRRAYLRAGTGYGGPDDWRHGKYMGRNWSSSVAYDLRDPAVTARIGPTHVLCRMTMDSGEVGYGTFETQVFGAFPKYGFHE
ncbi:MAG: hypothetical protein ACT4PZ_22570 [Panacagrimonas sp.]